VTSSPDNKPLRHPNQCSEALPSSSGKQSTCFRFPTLFFFLSSSTITHSPSTSNHFALLHRSLHHIDTTNRLQSSFFRGSSINLVHQHRCNAPLHRHRLPSPFLRRPSITPHSALSKCNAIPSFLTPRLETLWLYLVCFPSISSELVLLLMS
jgi:hypothetical protein